MISIEEAFEKLAATIAPIGVETVSLAELAGRILQEDLSADLDSPPYDKSMMDGFAVRSQDVTSKDKCFSIIETVTAGEQASNRLVANSATRIMTGAPIPEDADAILMVELAEEIESNGQTQVRFDLDHVAPEKHLLRQGTNFSNGDVLFTKGTSIRAHDVGLLAEIGVTTAKVGTRPTIAVLPTGDELVGHAQKPSNAQIRNSNSPMISSLGRSLGFSVEELEVGRDDEAQLRQLMQQALQQDVLILTGGVSAGQKDLVPSVLKSLGVKEVFHKVRIKPGKPIWFGVTGDEKPTYVFGLPGNPVSSLVGFQLFVASALQGLMGGAIEHPKMITATLANGHQARGNRPTYWPAAWSAGSITNAVEPLRWNGSSDLRALGLADGFVFFDAQKLEFEAGEEVPFLSL
ncbi:MAG: gephyrin-like molybdotransferase Glp [Planctomycetota bacterium]